MGVGRRGAALAAKAKAQGAEAAAAGSEVMFVGSEVTVRDDRTAMSGNGLVRGTLSLFCLSQSRVGVVASADAAVQISVG